MGAQLIASVLSSRVTPNSEKEIGRFSKARADAHDHTLLALLPRRFTPLHLHCVNFDSHDSALLFGKFEARGHQGLVLEEKIRAMQFNSEIGEHDTASLLAEKQLSCTRTKSFTSNCEALIEGEAWHRKKNQLLLFALLDRRATT